MPVIYLDILVAVNWFIDFLLLAGTARLLRLPYRRRRLVLAGLIGGVSCCLVLLPMHWLLLTMYKIGAAFGIIRAAFRWEGWRLYIKQTAVFFVVSAIFAGIATALWAFAAPRGMYMAGGVVYYDVSPVLLAALTAVSYLAVCLYERIFRRRAPDGHDYRLRIKMGERQTELRVMYDSGNALVEPFSGKPAAVVTLAAVREILPPEWLPDMLHPTGGKTHPGWRVIPYRTIGGTGLLTGFMPDQMTVTRSDIPKNAPATRGRDISGSYLAVCETLGKDDWQGLISSSMLNA